MDMKKYWFRSASLKASIRLGRSYTTRPRNYRSYYGAKPVWEMIWRKLRRGKKKVFSSAAMEGVYDPETYSKNFDQGMESMEPENLCRSFSARFADPSRILPPRHLLDS